MLEAQGSALGDNEDSTAMIPLSTGMALLSDAQRRQLIFQARIDSKATVEEGADLVKDALPAVMRRRCLAIRNGVAIPPEPLRFDQISARKLRLLYLGRIVQ